MVLIYFMYSGNPHTLALSVSLLFPVYFTLVLLPLPAEVMGTYSMHSTTHSCTADMHIHTYTVITSVESVIYTR